MVTADEAFDTPNHSELDEELVSLMCKMSNWNHRTLDNLIELLNEAGYPIPFTQQEARNGLASMKMKIESIPFLEELLFKECTKIPLY